MSSDIPSAAQAIRHDLLEDVEIDANVAARGVAYYYPALTFADFATMRQISHHFLKS